MDRSRRRDLRVHVGFTCGPRKDCAVDAVDIFPNTRSIVFSVRHRSFRCFQYTSMSVQGHVRDARLSRLQDLFWSSRLTISSKASWEHIISCRLRLSKHACGCHVVNFSSEFLAASRHQNPVDGAARQFQFWLSFHTCQTAVATPSGAHQVTLHWLDELHDWCRKLLRCSIQLTVEPLFVVSS